MKRRAPAYACASLCACALLQTACSDDVPGADACEDLATTWSLDTIPETTGCANPPEPRDLAQESKLALALYHFDIQSHDAAEEDRIITQTLEPLLDLYLANQTFHADIALQGYAIEIIAQRHAGVLEKMRTLAQRGQVEFDGFHYSNQLFLAYPKIDLERSLELTRQIFERTCLPRGATVHAQEGQFARGQLKIAAAHGYEVSILPKAIFEHQFAATSTVFHRDAAAPDHAVLIGGQNMTGARAIEWAFFGDAANAFSDSTRLESHRQALAALEQQGFESATVREAVRALKQHQEPAPLPPVLDGIGPSNGALDVFRWMGGDGANRTTERDSDILAAVWKARSFVERADRQAAGKSATVDRGLLAAWREVLLAETSRSTGPNPTSADQNYALFHAARASALAGQTLSCAGLDPIPAAEITCVGDEPADLDALDVEIIAPSRRLTLNAFECLRPLAGLRTIEISLRFPPVAGEEPAMDPSAEIASEREVEVFFTRTGTTIVFDPALEEELRSIDLSPYVFEETALALPSGLIALGTRRWVVQDHVRNRNAVIVRRNDQRISFRDRTVSRAEASRRRWWVIEGATAEQAAAFAKVLRQ